ncbi:SH3 domain-containing protein [Chryseobacterium tructae]|uniref:SH3 domain-containing protein n=1 Tax=Chryseobacterium tructae TaxID=1037380 RepID=A0ABV7XZL6_9FLAO|nr:SH3 domain-containing protein [Chryseobacterium tructae]MDN3694160.1 SH3 domain-containing protein [Chryseobacterium tructae]
MKNLTPYILVGFSLFISCNGQENKSQKNKETKNKEMNSLKNAPYNITDDGDGTKSNYDDLSPEFIKTEKRILDQRKFQFPDENTFNHKIAEVFSINLKEYSNPIIALRLSMFPEVAIRKDQFIFIQDANANEPEFINPDLLYHFNSYVFYNTPVSYIWLQSNSPNLLYDLVVHYGYNKDKKLVESIFKKFDFNSLSEMEELIFSDSGTHKKLKKQIFDDIETIIYKGKVEDFSYAKEGNGYLRIGEIINTISASPKEYDEPEQTISYLFERELRVGIQGDIESYLNKNPQYQSNLEKNNFYDLPTLKKYVKYIYQKESNVIFTVQDADGYTNLRKDKNSSSQILQKINTGEQIDVLDQSGDWWLVVSKEGKKGYVHKSRIKSE